MSLLTSTTQAPANDDVVLIPDQSRAERRTSFDPADFPVPSGREEEWRFTPVDRLGPFFEDVPTPAHLDWQDELPDGVALSTISVAEWRAAGVPVPADRAAAIAASRSDGVAVLDILQDHVVSSPVRIGVSAADGRRVLGHLLIRAGRFAKATVVLDHTGVAAYNEMLTIVADEGAELTFVSLQQWDEQSYHLGQHDVLVGRDARVRHVAVTLGGSLVRLNTNARYAGPGGSFEGFGVYFADAGQHLEHRLFVDHEAPHCMSRVEYKGALQGETARTVWIGDVLIRATAQGTDTYELNRNLLLTDGARADSVPNLEIETGEIVGAGHASATGRFDDEQLFYLMARGIPEAVARQLVVRGFFTSIIAKIGVPEVEAQLADAVERELTAQAGNV